MPSYVTNESPDVIIGWEAISRYLGVCSSTVRKWRREQGFPVTVYPDGRYATTKNLIEQWFMARDTLIQGHQGRMYHARESNPLPGHGMRDRTDSDPENGLGTR